MKLTKNMITNMWRLGYTLISFICIFIGIFIKDISVLTYIGFFILGNVLGQLK